MPQLNPEFYISQIFWLTITFIFLLFFLWKFSIPKIRNVIEKRESKINKDLQNAKKLQIESENLQKKIDNSMDKTKLKAQEILKISINDFKNEADNKIKELDQALDKKILETNININKTKKIALNNLKKEVEILTLVAVKKLTEKDFEENIIKKEMDKIYTDSKDLN